MKNDKAKDLSSDKLKALKLTIEKIDKDFGKGSVMMMNETWGKNNGSYFNWFYWF